MTGPAQHRAAVSLVERERSLPGLAVVLDSDALADRLGAPVRVHRLRYKPATSVQAAITLGDDWHLVAGYTPWNAVKLARHRTTARRRRLEPLYDDARERCIVVPATADRAFAARALADTADADTVIAYNPRRRLVRRGVSVADGPWVAKIYGAGQRRVDPGLADALNGCGVRTAPTLPARHPAVHRAAWQPGRAACPATDADLVGAAVDRLAGARPAVVLADTTITALVTSVGAALRQVAIVAPGHASAAAALHLAICRVTERLVRLPRVVVHGDLSADQVVVDGADAWFVDLDQCAWGPEGWDRATWIAAQVIDGDAAPVALPGPPPDPALVAIAIALRTPEPFARQHDEWAGAIQRGLAAAADLLGAGDHSIGAR